MTERIVTERTRRVLNLRDIESLPCEQEPDVKTASPGAILARNLRLTRGCPAPRWVIRPDERGGRPNAVRGRVRYSYQQIQSYKDGCVDALKFIKSLFREGVK